MANTYATEKALESRFVKWCKSNGAQAVKGPAMYAKGIPDRFVLLPNGGGTIYVEVKGTSYYGLTPMQEWWKKFIQNSSPHRYFVIEDLEELAHLIETCEKFIKIGNDLTKAEYDLLKALQE